MIRINLIAPERTAQKKKAATPGAGSAYGFLLLFGGGAAAVCGILWFLESSKIESIEKEIKKAEAEKTRLESVAKKVAELDNKRTVLKAKVKVITDLKDAQGGPVHMLDEISKALPDFVWLSTMTQTGQTIKFGGQSNNLTAVADFIGRLQQAGEKCKPEDKTGCWFPRVELETSAEANNIITFSLGADFRNPTTAQKDKEAAAKATTPTPAAAPAAAKKP